VSHFKTYVEDVQIAKTVGVRTFVTLHCKRVKRSVTLLETCERIVELAEIENGLAALLLHGLKGATILYRKKRYLGEDEIMEIKINSQN